VSVRLRGKVIGGSALAFGTLLVFHVVAAVVGVRLLTMLARK
jgi:hypothetical protein